MTSEKLRRWTTEHPYGALTLATVAMLLPFLAKPFNIDDPLFLWCARQIQLHPADPFGFNVAWYSSVLPMWQVTENPPLTSYYLALATKVLGWSELAVHFSLLPAAIAVVLGTFRLAGNYCRQPFLAALVALSAPAFLISADTAMCDVMMLAFWTWAVVLWVEGLAISPGNMAMAGVLMGLASLTKYYGICLIPLLAAYALARRQPLRHWGQYLLIPLAALLAYQCGMHRYDYVLFRAVNYVSASHIFAGMSKWRSILCGLAFTGGCLAPIVFFAGLLWSRKGLWLFAALATVPTGFVLLNGAWFKTYSLLPAGALPWVKIQFVFWIMAGAAVLALTARNWWQRRDANAVLLVLWMGGTFCFATLINWTVNARSILPMTPALAILIVQQLERERKTITSGMWVALVSCGLFGVLAESADLNGALAVRNSVDAVLQKYAQAPGRLWYEGHWGFQFYMNEADGMAADTIHPQFRPGDLLVVPVGNTNVQRPAQAVSRLLDAFDLPVGGFMATFNGWSGGGFYAAVIGPLPFSIGPVPPEVVEVYLLTPVQGAISKMRAPEPRP